MDAINEHPTHWGYNIHKIQATTLKYLLGIRKKDVLVGESNKEAEGPGHPSTHSGPRHVVFFTDLTVHGPRRQEP